MRVEQLFEPLIALLRAEFGDDLLGVLATGSRIHGTPGPTSDLDLHVVIDQPRRQRRNIMLDGLEIEMFINPPFQIHRYLADGGNDAHMFAFGRAIYDPQSLVGQLQEQARAIWQAGPPALANSALWMPRYFAADMLRDLIDLGDDQAATSLQIARIVDHLIETHCHLNQRWPSKPKRRLAELDAWAPDVAQLAGAALTEKPLAERRAAIQRMAELVLAPIGGLMPLEWRNEWEPLSEASRAIPSEAH
jgi:predicted nucleotidyltransferase